MFNNKWALPAILIIGVFARFALVYFHPYPDTNDAAQYDRMAQNLAKGNGLSQELTSPYKPEIDRVPFYPVFLSFFYLAFGHHLSVIRLAQAALSVATVYLIYVLAKKIDSVSFKALPELSAKLVLLCPFLIIFVSILFTETLDTFLITLALLLFVLAVYDRRSSAYFFSGLAMGLAFLTRPEAFAFPFILAVGLFISNWRVPEKALKAVVFFLVPFLLLWGGWVVRNYAVFNRFVPITTQDGAMLLIGTYSPNRYSKDFPEEIRKEYLDFRFIDEKDRINVVSVMRQRAFQRIADDPLRYISYCLQRVPILWLSSYAHYVGLDATFQELLSGVSGQGRELKSVISNMAKIFLKVLFLLINITYIVLGLLGIYLLWGYWPKIYPLYLAVGYFTLVHLPLGDASPRYVVKILPVFMIFVSAGALFLSNFLSHRLCHAKD